MVLSKANSNLIPLKWHDTCSQLHKRFRFLMLLGDTCCGKSAWAIEQSRIANGGEPLICALSPESERSDVWGNIALLSDGLGGTISQMIDGAYAIAMGRGLTVVIDELGTASYDMLATMLSSRGQDVVVNPINLSTIHVHKDFRVIATANLVSLSCQRSTTQMIAKALFDEFVVFEVPRIEVGTIRKMLISQFPQAKPKNVDRAIELWESYRAVRDDNSDESQSGESFLTYRSASQVLQMLEDEIPEDVAVMSGICGKFLTDDDLFKVAKLRASIS